MRVCLECVRGCEHVCSGESMMNGGAQGETKHRVERHQSFPELRSSSMDRPTEVLPDSPCNARYQLSKLLACNVTGSNIGF